LVVILLHMPPWPFLRESVSSDNFEMVSCMPLSVLHSCSF
jgi:hypothetical protein